MESLEEDHDRPGTLSERPGSPEAAEGSPVDQKSDAELLGYRLGDALVGIEAEPGGSTCRLPLLGTQGGLADHRLTGPQGLIAGGLDRRSEDRGPPAGAQIAVGTERISDVIDGSHGCAAVRHVSWWVKGEVAMVCRAAGDDQRVAGSGLPLADGVLCDPAGTTVDATRAVIGDLRRHEPTELVRHVGDDDESRLTLSMVVAY